MEGEAVETAKCEAPLRTVAPVNSRPKPFRLATLRMLPGFVRPAFWSVLLRALGPEPERLTVTAVSPVRMTSPPRSCEARVDKPLPSAENTRPPAAVMVPA